MITIEMIGDDDGNDDHESNDDGDDDNDKNCSELMRKVAIPA